MIKVKSTKKENYFKEIVISGHANYADKGFDIVCSAVSSIVVTTVNAIESICKDAISYEDNNILKIKVIKKDEITNKLLINMINMLQELEEAYPKNIKML